VSLPLRFLSRDFVLMISPSMIPKSGHRFSEKIMLQQKVSRP
jgi:hypothetical protein